MSYQRGKGRSGDIGGGGRSSAGGVSPGKRSLTGQLQRRARAGAAPSEAPEEPTSSPGLTDGTVGPDARSIAASGLTGSSTALPYADQIQASFGHHSIAGISAHVGGAATAASDALGAHGYATGNSVAFAHSPDLHTAAHEAAHVVQQRAGVHLKAGMGEPGDTHEQHADAVADAVVRGQSAEHLLDQYSGGGGNDAVQCSFAETRPIPDGHSSFEFDLQTRTVAGGDVKSGLDGYIRFVPAAGDQNSNTITIVQVGSLVDSTTGDDVRGGSKPPNVHPRGELGERGLRTEAHDDVEGGFATDTYHNRETPGTPASPRYNFEPNAAGTPAPPPGHGSTPGPAGGTGGHVGNTPGFKRSDLPEDMKSATMYDFPGVGGTTRNLDFEFQAVARGEDTQHDYGTVNWGFGLRAGAVINEHLTVTAGASATFAEALERHRDFYTHETVTIYFEFDRDVVAGAELAKVTALAEYLRRNPEVVMTLDGFADQRGNAAYNVDLSQRRVNNTRNALIDAHPTFPAANIRANTVVPAGGHGASTEHTDATSEQPAGTGDLGGDAVNGADQDREANRQFNRRVTINFSHPAGTGPTAPGGVASPP